MDGAHHGATQTKSPAIDGLGPGSGHLLCLRYLCDRYVLVSRHQGMRLESIRFNLTEEDFVKALSFIRTHLAPAPDPYEDLYEFE